MPKVKWVKCPLEKCDTAYGVGKFPAETRPEWKAKRMMIEHILEYHSLFDILEKLMDEYIKVVEEDDEG